MPKFKIGDLVQNKHYNGAAIIISLYRKSFLNGTVMAEYEIYILRKDRVLICEAHQLSKWSQHDAVFDS